MSRKLLAEFLGTAGLLIVVVGSGIMGESLAQGNEAIALLANSIATGAGLYTLIQTFGPISGGHFNPAVSLGELIWKRMTVKEMLSYSLVQILGGIVGVILTHVMFGKDLFELSTHDRAGFPFFVSEVVATLGLLVVIALSGKRKVEATPTAVSLFITSAYWCTSSTAFANPAVTIARSLTKTFTGISHASVPGFMIAQFVGVILAILLVNKLESSHHSGDRVEGNSSVDNALP